MGGPTGHKQPLHSTKPLYEPNARQSAENRDLERAGIIFAQIFCNDPHRLCWDVVLKGIRPRSALSTRETAHLFLGTTKNGTFWGRFRPQNRHVLGGPTLTGADLERRQRINLLSGAYQIVRAKGYPNCHGSIWFGCRSSTHSTISTFAILGTFRPLKSDPRPFQEKSAPHGDCGVLTRSTDTIRKLRPFPH